MRLNGGPYTPPAATAGFIVPLVTLPPCVHPHTANLPQAYPPPAPSAPVTNDFSTPSTAYTPATGQPQSMLFSHQTQHPTFQHVNAHNSMGASQPAAPPHLMQQHSSVSSGMLNPLAQAPSDGDGFTDGTGHNYTHGMAAPSQQYGGWNHPPQHASSSDNTLLDPSASNFGQYRLYHHTTGPN